MSISLKKEIKKIDAIKDEDIDTSDMPEFDEKFWTKAVVEYPDKKRHLTIRLDEYVVDWFQKKGKGYQTKINAVLKTFVDAHIESK